MAIFTLEKIIQSSFFKYQNKKYSGKEFIAEKSAKGILQGHKIKLIKLLPYMHMANALTYI